MNLTSDKTEILKQVPDFTVWKEAENWLSQGQQIVKGLIPEQTVELKFASLTWAEIAQNHALPFGLYASLNWRKFVLAVFLADLTSYSHPIDQVNFERLLFLMHAFPQGFRTWWLNIEGVWWPVGYTGWYPMLETMFEVFENQPEKLKNRMVVPYVGKNDKNSFVYIFNYSVSPPLKGGTVTKALMKEFVQEINSQKLAGLACITVSDDGIRVAERFGMEYSGQLTIDGCPEHVYLKRF